MTIMQRKITLYVNHLGYFQKMELTEANDFYTLANDIRNIND